jgi:hypothetical protein
MNISSKRYIGVLDIQQDTDGVSVVGNGLDDYFRLRTMVRSVSPLIEEAGGYIINSRSELTGSQNIEVFSKTTLLIDRNCSVFKKPRCMRGITEVYGGPSDKQLHPNVTFHKHDDVSSIEELIDKLKRHQEALRVQEGQSFSEDQNSTSADTSEPPSPAVEASRRLAAISPRGK